MIADLKETPLSSLIVEGREFYVKRDDLIDPYLAGNKYRKLYTLLQTPRSTFQKIVSYGGTQSNAMLAIATLCKMKGWAFDYYTKPLNRVLQERATGNFLYAKELGMKHIELPLELYRDSIASMRLNLSSDTYIVDQGGADDGAREGIRLLAEEIRDSSCDARSVATPSGTGTTALYLALEMPEYRVYTVPVVGNVSYLKEQMRALHPIPDNLIILEPKKKYHFAKLYPEFLEIYTKTKEAGVEFDLLYAPSMWLSLLSETDEKLIYIHSGGVSGNASMLERYSKKSSL